ncbi:DUF5819 family protein [Curtobacterium sp. RHCKG23]|jgi:hypothetical protein|uniref:DUF5819 family protein n=1 Tax=Curtobacterium citri TaxID=3055139 RepID=A0ABT7T4K4_9MICO|nr:DUF5819 family protein [Curtobacterium citri]MDM7884502.1 DUF5819 family protein [Curtobacterium citri]
MKERLCSAASVLVVCTYAVLALVLAGPVTPISFALAPVAHRIEPWFSQSWQLFAPDPISEERGVLARVMCGRRATGFVDITTPGISRSNSRRVFPSRESRVISNLLVQRFMEDPVSERLAEKNIERPRQLDDEAQRAQDEAEQLLARYAAQRIDCAKGSHPTAVQLRYVFHRFPGWSRRTAPDSPEHTRVEESQWITL